MTNGKTIRKKAAVLARKHWARIFAPCLLSQLFLMSPQWICPPGAARILAVDLITIAISPFSPSR